MFGRYEPRPADDPLAIATATLSTSAQAVAAVPIVHDWETRSVD